MSRSRFVAALALSVVGIGAGAAAIARGRTNEPASAESTPTLVTHSEISLAPSGSKKRVPCPARTLADNHVCIPVSRTRGGRTLKVQPRTAQAMPEGALRSSTVWRTLARTPFDSETSALNWKLEGTDVQLPNLIASETLHQLDWGPKVPDDTPAESGSMRLLSDTKWLLLATTPDPAVGSGKHGKRLVLIWGLSSIRTQTREELANHRRIGSSRHKRVWLAVRRDRPTATDEPLSSKELWNRSSPLPMKKWLRAEPEVSP